MRKARDKGAVQGNRTFSEHSGDLHYSTLQTPIPPHLRARLQAVAAVTGRSVAELLESWLAKEIDSLDDARKEVADRIASSALKVDPE